MQRSSKYGVNTSDIDQIEHHYQNQQTKSHPKEIKQMSPNGQPVTPKVHYRITRNPSLTSSIMSESEKKTCSFFVLILAVVLQFLAVITICVTFIFPFWTWLKFTLPTGTLNSSGKLNITNTEAMITLTASNQSNGLYSAIQTLDSIKFDMGLWDLKTYRTLSIMDINNPNMLAGSLPTMRWTTGDMKSNTFIYMYITLIGLSSSTIFGIQILEILHLIFTLLTMCATSVTLCLCTNRRASLAWYLVCFLLTLLSMFLGLAVIIIAIAFQAVPINNLGPSTLTVVKGFGFCFWLSVVVQCLLVGSACLILTYVIIASCTWYQKNREAAKRVPKSKKAGFNNMTKIPRLQVDSSSPNTSGGSKELDSPINAFSNLHQVDPHQPNTAYVFYTGHGNYHKNDGQQAGEFYQPPPEHLVNYSLMMQNRKHAKGNEHPYSNVLVEQINHAYNGPS